MLFAERDHDQPTELAGLPELALQRLSDADARELLASSRPGPLDERVAQRIIAEARGNPLALLELPHGVSSASLAGGFAVADSLPLQSRVEASFRRRVDQLPEETQRLLLLGAAEPTGDPTLLWRAAAELGLPIEAGAPAEAADLIAVGTRVTFRHPLLRSAIYHAASARRAAERPSRAGKGHGSRARSRSPCLASRACCASDQTRRLPPSSSSRPAVRRRAPGSAPRPRSWSAQSR